MLEIVEDSIDQGENKENESLSTNLKNNPRAESTKENNSESSDDEIVQPKKRQLLNDSSDDDLDPPKDEETKQSDPEDFLRKELDSFASDTEKKVGKKRILKNFESENECSDESSKNRGQKSALEDSDGSLGRLEDMEIALSNGKKEMSKKKKKNPKKKKSTSMDRDSGDSVDPINLPGGNEDSHVSSFPILAEESDDSDNSLLDNTEDDDQESVKKTKAIKKKSKSQKIESESEYSESSDNEITRGDVESSSKKKKKLTKKKSKSSDRNSGDSLSGTDDEVKKGTNIFDAAMSDESDSSVGLPQDLHIVRKGDEKVPGEKKKKKIVKDFDIEQWQNEEHKEKVYGEHEEGSGKKQKKKDKDALDSVAQLVSDRQRMLREREVRLPRHDPAPLQLSDCLSRIPKLHAIRPKPRDQTDEKPAFVPTLSAKGDEFFLPKDLGNFMSRFKKHMCLSAKVVTSSEHPTLSGPGLSNPTVTNPPAKKPALPLNTDKIITKKQLQEQLKNKILAKKIETRKAAELERMIDEEDIPRDEDEAALEKLLEDENEEDMSDSGEDNDVGDADEDMDDVADRRAERILLGEEISSSEEEEEGTEQRKYHSDTDSDLLASADEVHVDELPPDSADEDGGNVLQPSRYSLRRLTRYIRKKRLTKTRGKPGGDAEEMPEEDKGKTDKMERATKKMEILLEKRKEFRQKKAEAREIMRKRDEEMKRIANIKRKAEVDARLAEERASRIQSQPQPKEPVRKAVNKPWLSSSEEEGDLPAFDLDEDKLACSTQGDALTKNNSFTSAQRVCRNWNDDSFLESRAARILAGENLSSSESEPERNYHSDTDSDMLASADEVHVRELPATSASEDDALQPSRYSLRRLTRYCRKKRVKRERRHNNKISIGSESEKEEKAKRRLKEILQRREKIRQKLSTKKPAAALTKENSCSSFQDLFGRDSLSLSNHSSLPSNQNRPISFTGISSTGKPERSQYLSLTSGDLPITSTIIPDSLDALPLSEKTFDVDTAARDVIEDSQLEAQQHEFLNPDEDAVFLDTQGHLRSGLDISGDGGIEGLGGSQMIADSQDMLALCSGQFASSAPSSGGRVTVQDISFNLHSGNSVTPTATPISKASKGFSQTPLLRYGVLDSQGLLDRESDDDSRETAVFTKKKGKRRSLYHDMLDGEAEKSGSDHSDDEFEGEEDEFDSSMLAKEEDLPSDEEELARHLMERYQDDAALQDKHLLKKLKERFVHEEQGFFRTRKFRPEDEGSRDLFSTNLGLDEEDDVEATAEGYKLAMDRRKELMKKDQWVKERRSKETDSIDDDSQAFLDSMVDITNTNSRSAFSSSQSCGSFLKHKTDTLSRLSNITSNSINSDKSSGRGYVFQTVDPSNNKRRNTDELTSSSKRPKKLAQNQSQKGAGEKPAKSAKSIFAMIK